MLLVANGLLAVVAFGWLGWLSARPVRTQTIVVVLTVPGTSLLVILSSRLLPRTVTAAGAWSQRLAFGSLAPASAASRTVG